MLSELPFTLSALRQAYAEGVRPEDVIAEAFRRLDAVADPGIFIHEAREAALAEARALGTPDGRPLWGIPYAAKDNIDVAGMPTTAACPDFSYEPAGDAFVVARLRAAGAICLGKTNLDQFATGLVGVRTPFPIPNNAIDPDIVPGGSSAGSAVLVSHGIACFALGTDTAGSGRVPAALNNLVGLKPTLGTLSASGVVPACRTLDTISIFALTVTDAYEVFETASAFDPADAYAREIRTGPLAALSPGVVIAMPNAATLETFGDAEQAAHFSATIARLEARGAIVKPIDLSPFYDVAQMLYEGAWVAERTAAVGARITEASGTLHPTTLAIVSGGLEKSAVDTFKGIYRLQELRRVCEQLLVGVDFLCVPTVPTFVTREEIDADPIGPNSRLGTYTNFVNLLDMCGIAVPTGVRADGRPGNITVLARAGEDDRAAGLALMMEAGLLGATRWPRPEVALATTRLRDDEIAVAVCGAHMSGLPLNSELTSRGGRLLRATETAPDYTLYALAGGPPFRPGMVRTAPGTGTSISLEVWALPKPAFGSFMAGIPAPLCIGSVMLADGTSVKGFLCEPAGIEGATDISALGGWRAYLAQGKPSRAASVR
ncbi:allophanate hydrolase [Pelagibacterium halotolerans]|uniref:allophanate hydrolase n=1 Tax=Pelagibacterium halotolerans TaxID=531813 RepID=UPI00384E05F0